MLKYKYTKLKKTLKKIKKVYKTYHGESATIIAAN